MNERPVEPVVLRETPRWVVVDKPAGWHTVARRTGTARTAESDAGAADESDPSVEAWLRRTRPELASLPEAGIVHRLDRSTSGTLLVARTDAAYRALRRSISDLSGEIRKVYLAATRHGMAFEGSLRLYYRSRHRGSAKISVSESGSAEECGRLQWIRVSQSAEADLAEVQLMGPGRRHQIRAGFAWLGYPLIGDELYRGDRVTPEFESLPGLSGAALHAWRILVDSIEVTAPLPPAWNHFQEAISRRTDDRSIHKPTSAG